MVNFLPSLLHVPVYKIPAPGIAFYYGCDITTMTQALTKTNSINALIASSIGFNQPAIEVVLNANVEHPHVITMLNRIFHSQLVRGSGHINNVILFHE